MCRHYRTLKTRACPRTLPPRRSDCDSREGADPYPLEATPWVSPILLREVGGKTYSPYPHKLFIPLTRIPSVKRSYLLHHFLGVARGLRNLRPIDAYVVKP